MLKPYRVDLHIHTCLSPCADIDMTPKRILSRAQERDLKIIAVTDHNSAENFPAFQDLADGITVLPGMEINTAEEVHILALFPTFEQALQVQKVVYDDLPVQKNSRMSFEQMVVNAQGQLVHFLDRHLIDPIKKNLKETVELIHHHGGLAIASHIDRDLYGIIGTLGRIPEDVAFDALEISYQTPPEEAKKRFNIYRHLPWLWSSDAHQISQIGRSPTVMLLKEPSFEEITRALRGENGRKIVLN